jgi:hypothetical protein
MTRVDNGVDDRVDNRVDIGVDIGVDDADVDGVAARRVEGATPPRVGDACDGRAARSRAPVSETPRILASGRACASSPTRGPRLAEEHAMPPHRSSILVLGTMAACAGVATISCTSSDASDDHGDANGVDSIASGDSGSSGDVRNETSAHDSGVGSDSGHAGDSIGSDGGGGFDGGPSGCAPLAVSAGVTVEGSKADTFAWSDADCRPRTASLFRNDTTDAFGERGGYLRAISYEVAGKRRDIKGTGANGWQGFGYIINHYASTASETQHIGGTTTTVLAGRHHAIHEFKWRISPGGSVDVTAHWFFATGRSHPLFSITYDATPAGPDVVAADTRAPYGDLAWDDGVGGDVSGIGWGDAYRFTTTGSGPVTPHSPWDYSKTNVVPHAFEWSNATDAEMGLVATLPFATHVGGGDYGGGTIMGSWGKSGSDLLTDVADWDWPFQLNQWELPFETTSHRLAWGTTYGAVGQRSYDSFGKTLSGYPYQSYAVFVVLGTHATSAVEAQIAEVDAEAHVVVTATRGTVATDGVAGVGRTDRVTFSPVGFDPVYAAWAVDAASNAATIQIDAGAGSLRAPVLEIRNYDATTPPSTVTLDAHALVADTDYFATVDAPSHRLWLTVNSTLTGRSELAVE